MQLSTTLSEHADSLSIVIDRRADSLIHVGGDVGLGKTTFLLGLADRLKSSGMNPIVVAPPLRAIDTGPAVLAQIADRLREYGMLNGERATLEDPKAELDDRLNVVKQCVERSQARIVLLCDEPEQWLAVDGPEEPDDIFVQNRKQQIFDAIWNWRCRRVFAGSLPNNSHSRRLVEHRLPFDAVRFVEQTHGALDEVASVLNSHLGPRLSVSTSLARRLLVGFAKASSVVAAIEMYQDYPDVWEIAKRLLDALSQDQHLMPLRDLWASLALYRGAMSYEMVEELGARDLDNDCRAILYDSLLQPFGNDFMLHEVLKRLSALRNYQEPLARESHERLADFYIHRQMSNEGSQLFDQIEGFYHTALAGRSDTRELFPELCVEQLHILGRTLSKVYGNHVGAAKIFQEAVGINGLDDYSHHYWAYNLDWDATDETLVEREYRNAVDLNPEHPWWWSRLINFLITTGRMADARLAWNKAYAALDVPNRGPDDRVWWALHRWVARLLLHRGQVDFGRFVLHDVHEEPRTKNAHFLALGRLLRFLEQADNGESVFPWSVPPETWWTSPYPHRKFPLEFEGVPLRKWNPARVLKVDHEYVWLIAGKKQADENEVIYGEVAVPRPLFDVSSPEVPSSEIEPDRYLELAFYGDDEQLRIACYPSQVEMDKDLPGFDPPDPRRYLKRSAS